MSGLNENLLQNADQLTDAIQQVLLKIKQVNNDIQMNIAGDVDTDAIKILKKQKYQMTTDITTLKDLLIRLEKKSRTKVQQNKLKKFQTEGYKEIDRFGEIMKEMVNSSFAHQLNTNSFDNESTGNSVDMSDQERNQIKNQTKGQKNISLQDVSQSGYAKDIEKQQNQALMQQQLMQQINQDKQMMDDAKFEEDLQREKQEQFDLISHEVNQINDLMREVNEVVVDTGLQVDDMHDNLIATKENTIGTNQQLNKAEKDQKKTSCYIWLLVLAFVVVVITFIVLAAQGVI